MTTQETRRGADDREATQVAGSVPLLRADKLTKSYAGVQALRDASFDLRAGEVHALVGENGAGKSTLIKIITGAIEADGGEIVLDGRPLRNNTPRLAKSHGIAAIYQQPALFPELTVAENLALGLEPGGLWSRVDWKERRRRAVALLAQVGARIHPERLAGELSMPEQQLVEIARAVGADARVLLMDEPTASLSEDDAQHLFGVVRQLRAGGVGIIYISHRLDELPVIADRVTVLRDGRTIDTRMMKDVTSRELIQLMVGRELAAVFPKRAVPIGDVLLELRHLGCAAAGVRDVTLTVRAGEIVGVAGLVGAGRTELARTLFGLTPADAGEVLLRGERVTIGSPAQAIESGIAYLPEDRRQHGVIAGMPISANITLASLDRVSHFGAIRFAEERAVAAESTRQLGVKTPSIFAPVATLSGGNQQKVALGRWLVTQPLVLILDEPTQGIDVGAKAEIHALMVDLAARGVAILMISSELPEILGMSDRIAVMRGGTLAGTLDRADATQQNLLALAIQEQSGESGESGESAWRKRLTPSDEKLASVDSPDSPDSFPYKRELSAALAYVALLALVAVIAPSFYSFANLRDLAVNTAPVLLVAVGMTMVILVGEIDISVGSQFAVASVAVAWLAKSGVPVGLLPVSALVIGGLMGAVNGLLVGRLGLPSIIVTLATLAAWRDLLRWVTAGAWVQDLPANFQWFGLGQGAGQAVMIGVVLAGFFLFNWALRNLREGRALYAVGSDAEAARLSGFTPPRLVLGVFVLMGALTGLAALLNAARFSSVPGNSGLGLELKAIAAVVVGGTAITGGRGRLVGTLIGVALLGTIGTALTFLGINPFWEKAIQGAIILAALVSDTVLGRFERLPLAGFRIRSAR